MPADADRNLLFGVLALQMDYVSREQLVTAVNAWAENRLQPIGDLLCDQSALDNDTYSLLEAMVSQFLDFHQGDADKSMVALGEVGKSIYDDLNRIANEDVAATLDLIGDKPDSEVYRNESLALGTSSSIGDRFQILRPHAKGGLGAVSVALDRELSREVAVKEIQEHFADNPDSRSRFVLEAEITGGLEHPGIVPVYGLGVYSNGRPFYAMRFIQGDSFKKAIDRFHEAKRKTDWRHSESVLDLRKLLGRFVDVCNAIEYAHNRGILHRDIKPGNIMLGNYGETLVVDWGLAKVVGRLDPITDGDRTLQPASASGSAPTEMGSAIGTPAYMSPEQASGQLDQLGPSSDVYSLGATLYTLLVGRPPVYGDDKANILQDVQDGNLKPPRTWDAAIPKPLEAICLKAMSLRPQDRYSSPQQIVDDVERYLADETVSTFRDPFSVRLRRRMRKHPGVVAAIASTLIIGILSASTIASIVSYKNTELGKINSDLELQRNRAQDAETLAKNNEAEALQAAKDAKQVLEFFEHRVLSVARPTGQNTGLGIDVTVREAIDTAEPTVAISFVDSPRVEASIRNTLGLTYDYLGEYELAIEQFERAVQLRKETLGESHLDTATSMHNLGGVYRLAGRYQDSLDVLQESYDIQLNELGPEDSKTLNTMDNLAQTLIALGQFEAAITILERQLETLRNTNSDSLEHALGNLGTAYSESGQLDKAVPLLEESVNILKQNHGPQHVKTLTSMSNLAVVYSLLERNEESVRLHRQALEGRKTQLPDGHFDIVVSMHNLASVLRDMNDYDEAILVWEEGVDLLTRHGLRDHPRSVTVLSGLSNAYNRVNRHLDAIPLLEDILGIRTTYLGADDTSTLNVLVSLGITHIDAGLPEKAIENLEAAIDGLTRNPNDQLLRRANDWLAHAYVNSGRASDAIPIRQRRLLALQGELGADHALTLGHQLLLAKAFLKVQPSEALPLLEDYISRKRAVQPFDALEFASRLATVTIELLKHDQFETAENYARECVQIREELIPEDWLYFNTKSLLGGALLGQQKLDEAETWLLEGYQGMADREAMIPEQARARLLDAAQRLIDFYDVSDNQVEEEKWQSELESLSRPQGEDN